MFAHIEEGSIAYRGGLPRNWRNVSGLNLSAENLPFLKSLGWLPCNVTTITLGADEVQTDDQVTINADDVDVVETKRAMTAQEITDRNDILMAGLRETRDELLAGSDNRFLSDTPAGRGNQDWKDYRQALRDLPANTPDPTTITWPTPPV